MISIVLFDEQQARQNLLPLTFTRPVCELRLGIFTIREKWELMMQTKAGILTQLYLSKKYPLQFTKESIFINGKICPDENLVDTIKGLTTGQVLYKGETIVAYYGSPSDLDDFKEFKKIEYQAELLKVDHLWEIFLKNAEAIKKDFVWMKANKKTKPLSNTVTVIGDKDLIFLEEGAVVQACILNTSGGPIYVGADSEIMEGSAIRGPFALCANSTVKLNSKIYGATTVGPHCKVAGELSNTVIFGYSNKAHDGFLGNSVIGEWCNLGADTNNSNLKNNYGNVKLFNYDQNKQEDTGLQFCGLIMADHSKSGINTMFNTGTVVGVGSNIFGAGFPPTHVPSFSWGGSDGFETYDLRKLIETQEKVFERRGLIFDQTEKDVLRSVFEQTLR